MLLGINGPLYSLNFREKLGLKYSQVNKFLCTANFVSIFVGFFLVTSVLLPPNTLDDSLVRTVTIPYRAVMLCVAVLVVLFNFRHTDKSRFPVSFVAFLLFWMLLIVRLSYDSFRQDIDLGDTSMTWIYIFGICIPTILSVSVSIKVIDFEKAFWWILILTGVTFALIILKNDALFGLDAADIGRHQGNAAVSTISFGHYGATAMILSVYALYYKNTTFVSKFALLAIIMIGLFFVLRSGSRGPLLALVVVPIFAYFARVRRLSVALVAVAITLSILNLTFNLMVEAIGTISPILEARLITSSEEAGFGSRDKYYAEAIDLFIKSPVWGSQFLIIFDDGSPPDYAHNMLFDALMATGILGAILLLYFLYIGLMKSNYLLKKEHPEGWMALLLVQQIVFNMFSSAFYLNSILSALLVVILLKHRSTRYLSQRQ